MEYWGPATAALPWTAVYLPLSAVLRFPISPQAHEAVRRAAYSPDGQLTAVGISDPGWLAAVGVEPLIDGAPDEEDVPGTSKSTFRSVALATLIGPRPALLRTVHPVITRLAHLTGEAEGDLLRVLPTLLWAPAAIWDLGWPHPRARPRRDCTSTGSLGRTRDWPRAQVSHSPASFRRCGPRRRSSPAGGCRVRDGEITGEQPDQVVKPIAVIDLRDAHQVHVGKPLKQPACLARADSRRVRGGVGVERF